MFSLLNLFRYLYFLFNQLFILNFLCAFNQEVWFIFVFKLPLFLSSINFTWSFVALRFLTLCWSVRSPGVTTRLQTATWLLSREAQSLWYSASMGHLLPACRSWAVIPKCGREPWMLSGTKMHLFSCFLGFETRVSSRLKHISMWCYKCLGSPFPPCCRHWQDLGYLIIYVTGRPDMQKQRVVAWLSQHNFPHGIVSFCDGLVHDPLRHKANFLKSLTEVRLGLWGAFRF